jgi:hypothetical protein
MLQSAERQKLLGFFLFNQHADSVDSQESIKSNFMRAHNLMQALSRATPLWQDA